MEEGIRNGRFSSICAAVLAWAFTPRQLIYWAFDCLV
jgi:hypothetical protein